MLPKYLLLAVLLGAAYPALAQADDHLTPPTDAFMDDAELWTYRVELGRKLGVGRTHLPLVQVTVMPSFEPEYLLSVAQTGMNYTLTYRKATKNLWHASPHKVLANVTFLDPHGNTLTPPKPRIVPDSVQITTEQVLLQPRLAQALTDLFNVALAQTRYANNDLLRIDGTTFTFIARNEQLVYRSGNTWSPRPGTHMAALVKLVDGLQDLATHSDNRDFRQGILLSEAQDLLFDLAKR
ncbi:MAG: hypothetical protein ACRYFX_30630 [Janthinobacterium lividum]